LVWWALSFAPATALAAAPLTLPGDDSVRERLESFVRSHRGAPGVVVGLVDAHGRRYVAWGSTGRGDGPRLSERTRFEVGSITKTFTGVLFADMLLRGEVRADQTVGEFFPPELPLANGVQKTTLESLATHTSGLPRIPIDPAMLARALSADPYDGTTPDTLFASVAALPNGLVAPTTTLAYSNLGYALLGQLLARRAGTDYEGLLRGRVLEPLGLAAIDTRIPTPLPIDLARGHDANGRPTAHWHAGAYAPAGALVATTAQMLDWVALHLNPQAPPAVLEALRVRRTFSTQRAIGLGWIHGRIGERRLIWHNGGTGGFRSFIGFLPDDGAGIVVLANGNGDVDALARHLLDRDEPPPARHSASPVRVVITILLLLAAPMFVLPALVSLVRTRRSAGEIPTRVDRLDLVLMGIGLLFVLALAQRFGAWLDVSFGWWWLSAFLAWAMHAAAMALSLSALKFRPGFWRAVGRVLAYLPMLAVLVLMLR
jgi:CubicO group peptidase (beta-lactamase class C family)